MEEAEEKEEVEEEMEGGEPIKIGFGQRHMIVTMNYHDMQPFMYKIEISFKQPKIHMMVYKKPSCSQKKLLLGSLGAPGACYTENLFLLEPLSFQ